jgi:chitinase
VNISCTISGATIRYTTDGTDPTESSAEYTAPVAISQSCTLKAKAFKTGWTASAIKSAAYTIE